MMKPPDKRFSEFVGMVKSWIPHRSEPSNVSSLLDARLKPYGML